MCCMNLYILPKIKDSHNASSGALSGWIARLWCYWLSSGKAVSIFNEETSTRGKQQEQVLQTQYSVLCSWRLEKWSSPQMYFGVLHLHLIYPLTRGSLRHHRWLHNQLPPFFSVLYSSLGLGEIQACPFPGVLFPPLFVPVVSSFPFTVPCKMTLARPDERETCPYHFCLCLFMMVRRSSCGPVACWILVQTSTLVTWSLYEMRSVLR